MPPWLSGRIPFVGRRLYSTDGAALAACSVPAAKAPARPVYASSVDLPLLKPTA